MSDYEIALMNQKVLSLQTQLEQMRLLVEHLQAELAKRPCGHKPDIQADG